MMKKINFGQLFLFLSAALLFTSHAEAQVDKRCVEMLHILDSTLGIQVPEIRMLASYISTESKKSGEEISYIIHCADPIAKDSIHRDFYEMYVGGSNYKLDMQEAPISKRFFSFFIKKDLTEILFYDKEKNSYRSIQEVRQTEEWKEIIEQKKRWVEAYLK